MYSKSLALFLFFLIIIGSNSLSAQSAIPTSFYGMNAWMPDTIATTYYAGKVHQHWKKLKNAGTKTIRLGGIAPDQHFYTNSQLIRLVDSVKSIGAEPIVQVPLWANGFSSANAANIVQYLNITRGKNIKYFSIGNEANWVYNSGSFAAGSYTPAMYAAAVKSFSVAMKAVDPSIIIIAGELAWYDYTWVNALFDTTTPANDITGIDPVSGKNYVDIFSFHYYPFSGTQTRAQVIAATSGLQTSLTHLAGKLTAANTAHTNRTAPLQWAMTEANINWQNPASDNVNGLGANSFIGGQFWADLATTVLKNKGLFLNFWSVAEGGDGSLTDIGFISHTTGKLKPSYHHFNMISNYLQGSYYTTTGNQSLVKITATKHTEYGWAILLINYDDVNDFPLSLQLSTNPVVPSSTLNINVNGGINKTVTETLPKSSTMILFLTPNGHYQSKIVYSLSNAQAEQTPVFSTYQPGRNKYVLAHYLPWYNTNLAGAGIRAGWANPLFTLSDTNNVQVTYKPVIGEYSQLDRAVLRYHIRLAQAAHIDGFVVNINPVSSFQWKIFGMLCEEALALKTECPGKDFKLIVSYDNTSVNPTDVLTYFTQVRDSFYNKPAFSNLVFKDEITLKPVLQFWSDSDLSLYKQTVETVFGKDNILVFNRNATQFDNTEANFEWMGTLSNDPNNNTNWGNQYYNDFHWIMARQTEFGLSNLRSANPIQFGAVYPGFDDHNVPAYWNGGTARYIKRDVLSGEVMNLTWNIAQSYSPLLLGGNIAVSQPYVQVVTWNDFPEGTSVEPSDNNGYKYKALQTNRTRIAQWKGLTLPTEDTLGIYTPYHIYQAEKAGRTSDVSASLPLFCSNQYESAIAAAKGSTYLPIELLYFSGRVENEKNRLSWETASEQNCDYFELEKSPDAIAFKPIARMQSTCNSSTQTHYEYTDTEPIAAINYYKLKAVDLDGSFYFSEIIALRCKKENNIKIFPSPALDYLNIEMENQVSAEYFICNGLGQKLLQGIVKGNEPLEISQLAPGIYFFNINEENLMFVKE